MILTTDYVAQVSKALEMWSSIALLKDDPGASKIMAEASILLGMLAEDRDAYQKSATLASSRGIATAKTIPNAWFMHPPRA